MYFANLYALPLDGVAVPFNISDAWYDDLGASLPDCSVAFLNRACAWTARNSKSGFVPSSQLARLTGDPDLVTRTLRAAGIIRPVKGGGWRIITGNGITIVNASDEAEQVTRDMAEAERQRDMARERKRRQRAGETAERQERMTVGVTPMSRVTTADVTRDQTGIRKKPQVNDGHVTRDIGVTSRVTPPIDRSDLDQSSSGVGQSDAHARDPALLRIVAAGFSKRAGRIIGDAEAAQVIVTLTKRAEDAGTVIGRPRKYFAASVKNEADVEMLLIGDPPSMQEILAEPVTEPPPGGHAFVPGVQDRCKVCELPEANRREHPEEARTA
jgi:hypothetical protein